MNKKSRNRELDINAEKLGIGGYISPEKDDKAYKERMQKRKEIQEERLSHRNKEKSLVIIFTGNGKGKTTAALGMALRTLGHNQNVAIIQYIKGGWEPGEIRALKAFKDQVIFQALGEGFTWESQDRAKDKKLVIHAWERSLEYLSSPKYKLVILDEINIAIKLGYISLSEVIKGVSLRPSLTHVVLTGRGAPKGLIDSADLVTEMNLIHHPFREKGIKAQPGIEY